MNTCKDCKHWTRHERDHPVLPMYEHFSVFDVLYGECGSIFLVYEGPRSSKADELIYWDHEDYKAFVITGENFGCVHFEQQSET